MILTMKKTGAINNAKRKVGIMKVFKNIKELVQIRPSNVRFLAGADMKELPSIKDAYLVVENGKIASFGEMKNCPSTTGAEVIDCSGKLILPLRLQWLPRL